MVSSNIFFVISKIKHSNHYYRYLVQRLMNKTSLSSVSWWHWPIFLSRFLASESVFLSSSHDCFLTVCSLPNGSSIRWGVISHFFHYLITCITQTSLKRWFYQIIKLQQKFRWTVFKQFFFAVVVAFLVRGRDKKLITNPSQERTEHHEIKRHREQNWRVSRTLHITATEKTDNLFCPKVNLPSRKLSRIFDREFGRTSYLQNQWKEKLGERVKLRYSALFSL